MFYVNIGQGKKNPQLFIFARSEKQHFVIEIEGPTDLLLNGRKYKNLHLIS